MSFRISYCYQYALLSALLVQRAWSQTCISFGVDFQSDGSYFQNSLSSDAFTFVSQFQGCQNGVANNILVDPNGDETLCSDTNLEPDLTNQLSTCPIPKSSLISGEYSIIIISNNGDGDPIAYERDISLTVGPQQTSTYTPTVTLTATITPIVNLTSISTYPVTTTLNPLTVTSPSTTLHPTTTVTPAKVTTTTTTTIGTITRVKYTVAISQIVQTKTASCVLPTKQSNPDPTCTITPSLVVAAALQTSASAKFRRVLDRRVPFDRAQRIKERKERLARLQKRAPDLPTITVTDLNTADYVTSTTTSTATASTLTVVSITTITVTSTPPAITIFSGVSTSAIVTVTAPTPTKTKTAYVIALKVVTKTVTKTVTVQTTTTPAAALASCTKAGGTMNR